MTSYVRPRIDAPVFYDVAGQVVEFGNRWDPAPPEESYSVDAYPERFAPIHTVADALVAHLRETYDVELVEGDEVAGDLLHPTCGVVRAVRVQPRDPACAALTFVLTDYPGVKVHAGVLHDFGHPSCGCEACDSTWDLEADALEQEVFAVVSGHFRERVGRGRHPWVEYALTLPDGGESGRFRAGGLSAERLRAARPLLRAASGGWAAWPLAVTAGAPAAPEPSGENS